MDEIIANEFTYTEVRCRINLIKEYLNVYLTELESIVNIKSQCYVELESSVMFAFIRIFIFIPINTDKFSVEDDVICELRFRLIRGDNNMVYFLLEEETKEILIKSIKDLIIYVIYKLLIK